MGVGGFVPDFESGADDAVYGVQRMCGCFLLLLGAVFPRSALVLIQIFSNWNAQAFDSFWIGFAGWLFLPFTTVAYSVMNAWGDPINGFGWIFVVFGFIADLSSWFGAGARSRR